MINKRGSRRLRWMIIETIETYSFGILLLTESLDYNKECYVYTYLLSIYNKPISHEIFDTQLTFGNLESITLFTLLLCFFFFFFWQESHLVFHDSRTSNVLVAHRSASQRDIIKTKEARSRSRVLARSFPPSRCSKDDDKAKPFARARGSLPLNCVSADR